MNEDISAHTHTNLWMSNSPSNLNLRNVVKINQNSFRYENINSKYVWNINKFSFGIYDEKTEMR
jgi:hypothetical protein